MHLSLEFSKRRLRDHGDGDDRRDRRRPHGLRRDAASRPAAGQAIALEERQGAVVSTNDLAARVKLPSGLAAKIYEMVSPGTTLVVTDRTATGFTTTPADFTVLATDTPEPKP